MDVKVMCPFPEFSYDIILLYRYRKSKGAHADLCAVRREK